MHGYKSLTLIARPFALSGRWPFLIKCGTFKNVIFRANLAITYCLDNANGEVNVCEVDNQYLGNIHTYFEDIEDDLLKELQEKTIEPPSENNS